MKSSFITTVFNESTTIHVFLDSLLHQTLLPDEIIFVDGGSSDDTVKQIKKYTNKFKQKKTAFKVFIQKGNRSVGRNAAIDAAQHEIILCSDAGNILDKNWIKEIVKPFANKNTDVVAGYYKSKPQTTFQKCILPYAFVMPDKINPKDFLPSTRSIAFKKNAWEVAGRFDETLSHNEDYIFARELKKSGAKMAFNEKAIVYWIPRKTYKEAFIMFFRFAFGDVEAGVWRTKVILLFMRYLFLFYLALLSVLYRSVTALIIIVSLLLLYIGWSAAKNYKYVREKKALLILPCLQFTADIAVLAGSFLGFIKYSKKYSLWQFIKQNKIVTTVIGAYVFILLGTIQWGIPNFNHPFPYHMDEWHQLQAVRSTIAFGTPNREGAANGTMFYFLLSGFYLAFFTILHIVNPVTILITDLQMRERIFEILRIETIIWGVLSIGMIYAISKQLQLSTKVTVFFFTATPVWVLLSGYFKYDIALIFWILLSYHAIFRYAKNPNMSNYLFAAIPCAVAFAVKVSALPVFIMYLLAYFFFEKQKKANLKNIIFGGLIYISLAMLLGLPDSLFGKGNILSYLYDNIVHTPSLSQNFMIGMDPFLYILTHHIPVVFGYGNVFLFLCALIYLLRNIFSIKNRIIYYTLATFLLFMLSLVPLQLSAAGNRSLVILPSMVLLIAFVYKMITSVKKRKIFIFLLLIAGGIQLFQVFSWMYVRYSPAPQVVASEWIQSHIQKGTRIGVESIPIYQLLPEILQKEYYFEQYQVPNKNLYTYTIINAQSKTLPTVIVITDDIMESKLMRVSPKKTLVQRLEKEGYKRINVTEPDVRFLNIFASDTDYYLSGLMIASPRTTSVYRK